MKYCNTLLISATYIYFKIHSQRIKECTGFITDIDDEGRKIKFVVR